MKQKVPVDWLFSGTRLCLETNVLQNNAYSEPRCNVHLASNMTVVQLKKRGEHLRIIIQYIKHLCGYVFYLKALFTMVEDEVAELAKMCNVSLLR